mmetsp:Transcript_18398/g.42612  ORF Transcript_18398/g.42612 Transcript_18398/m.42612 type:complete len:223 (+) Transcript_18398:210-878(+)
MRKDGIAKALGVNKDVVEVRVVQADGDCFYASCGAALRKDPKCVGPRCTETASCSGGLVASVQELRGIVADEVMEENLDIMRVADSAGVEGYEHVRGLDLEGLKASLRRVAADEQGCVWADDFAVNAIAKRLDVVLLIVNEGARSGGSVLAIVPNSPRDDYQDLSCILLQRTRRVHYNLIELRRRTATPVTDLPSLVARSVAAAAIGDEEGQSAAGCKRKRR